MADGAKEGDDGDGDGDDGDGDGDGDAASRACAAGLRGPGQTVPFSWVPELLQLSS